MSGLAQSEYKAAVDQLKARALADPTLKEALLARLRAKCSKRHCRDEDMKTGFELAQSGIARLDGATLVARARLLSVVLKSVDEKSCAAIIRGSAEPAAVIAVMEKLGSSFLDSWLDISSKALIAELRQVPPRKLTDREVQQAEAELRAHLTKQERERLAAMPEDQRGIPDADECWTTRLIYEKLPALSEPHRSVMAVRLAQPE